MLFIIFFFSSRRRHTRCALVTGVQTCALPISILAPMQGIARDPKGNTTAMVVNAEGVVEQRPVVVSQTIGDQWLVESGLARSEERRVGKECVSTCRSRWAPDH